MKLTLKLYAGLTDYLPPEAEDNKLVVEISADNTANEVIDRCKVPRKMAHLVLLNGVYIKPEDRNSAVFNDGDTLAIWPPVAGGCAGDRRQTGVAISPDP